MTNIQNHTITNPSTSTDATPWAGAGAAHAEARGEHTLRTPYHELGQLGSGDGSLRVPAWAQHRSVYRSAGRTLYLVETDRLAEAGTDLDALARRGWHVRVDREGDAANITLSRQAA